LQRPGDRGHQVEGLNNHLEEAGSTGGW